MGKSFAISVGKWQKFSFSRFFPKHLSIGWISLIWFPVKVEELLANLSKGHTARPSLRGPKVRFRDIELPAKQRAQYNALIAKGYTRNQALAKLLELNSAK